MKTVFVALVALCVLSVGVTGAAAVGEQEETPEEEPEEEEPEEEEPVETPDNETDVDETVDNVTGDNETADVTIENQTSNGTALMVNSTTLPEGGFLVAYNSTMEMPLGNSTFLESGSQEDVNVTLDPPLTENQTLLVFSFQDTDGNEQFDLGTDEIYLSEGQPVLDSATVNVTSGNSTE